MSNWFSPKMGLSPFVASARPSFYLFIAYFVAIKEVCSLFSGEIVKILDRTKDPLYETNMERHYLIAISPQLTHTRWYFFMTEDEKKFFFFLALRRNTQSRPYRAHTSGYAAAARLLLIYFGFALHFFFRVCLCYLLLWGGKT